MQNNLKLIPPNNETKVLLHTCCAPCAGELIETMLWHPESGYWLLDLHLDRLAESAVYFSYPLELEKIRVALHELEADFETGTSMKSHRVRLTLSKSGVFEIIQSELYENIPPVSEPEIIMQQKSWNNLPKVIFSPRKTDSNSVFLFHKTTQRKLYDEERAEFVDEKGYYEVLFVNENDEVTEGSYSNIFLQIKGKLLTSPVSCGLLPGVLRRYLLQQYPGLVAEKTVRRKDFEQAEAVYIGNSVRGLVRVTL